MSSKLLASYVITAVVLSGCLKTRAQLKGDDPDNGPVQPVPAKVQEVQPQGGYVIDEVKTEITRLSGRVEDLERQQTQQSQAAPQANPAQTAELKKLEARIVELENAQAQMLEAMQKLKNQAPANVDTTDLFEKGRADAEGKHYEAAIESLSLYLKNPKGKHAEDATFIRGESFFEIKQYKKAILDYSKFAEKWTKSKHAPAALLRIAQSFEALGMKEDAKGFYREVLEKFPKSPEAKKAKAKAK